VLVRVVMVAGTTGRGRSALPQYAAFRCRTTLDMELKRLGTLGPRTRWEVWFKRFSFTNAELQHLEVLLEYAYNSRNGAMFFKLAKLCRCTASYARDRLFNAPAPCLGDDWAEAVHASKYDRVSWRFLKCWSCNLRNDATERNSNVFDFTDGVDKTVLLCKTCDRAYDMMYHSIQSCTDTGRVYLVGQKPVEFMPALSDAIKSIVVEKVDQQTWVNSGNKRTRSFYSIVLGLYVLGCKQSTRFVLTKAHTRRVFGRRRPKIGDRPQNPFLIFTGDSTYASDSGCFIDAVLSIVRLARKVQAARDANAAEPHGSKKAIRTKQWLSGCSHRYDYIKCGSAFPVWTLRSCTGCGFCDCDCEVCVVSN
jgi:hypothetical protein